MLKRAIRDALQWKQLLVDLAKHQGLSFRCDEAANLTPLSDTDLGFVVEASGLEFASARAKVVLITPEGEVALVLQPDAIRALQGIEFPEDRHASDSSDKPLWVQYDELSKAEKIKLARQGNAEARRLVARDRDQSLHPFLLQNPGLSGAEAAKLIRSGGAGLSFLKRLGQRSDLMSSPQVLEAIVKHPKTPVPQAVGLIAKLPIDLVRRIAKEGRLRMPIVKAARKRVIR